jgi:hypothetical protein
MNWRKASVHQNPNSPNWVKRRGELRGYLEQYQSKREWGEWVIYLFMELSSIGGEAEVAEDMAEAIEEEHLDAAQASDPRSPWGS